MSFLTVLATFNTCMAYSTLEYQIILICDVDLFTDFNILFGIQMCSTLAKICNLLKMLEMAF